IGSGPGQVRVEQALRIPLRTQLIVNLVGGESGAAQQLLQIRLDVGRLKNGRRQGCGGRLLRAAHGGYRDEDAENEEKKRPSHENDNARKELERGGNAPPAAGPRKMTDCTRGWERAGSEVVSV